MVKEVLLVDLLSSPDNVENTDSQMGERELKQKSLTEGITGFTKDKDLRRDRPRSVVCQKTRQVGVPFEEGACKSSAT